VQPVVTQFDIEVARCAECGWRAQARHPEQTSDALGAAVQIGPRALGLAAEMKHAWGVPYRKVTGILERGLGLRVSPGTLARAEQRLAAQAEPTSYHLLLALRESGVVHGDETGWKVAGEKAWLWVFTAEGVTVYTIDRRRSHEVAERILGTEFQGVLGCDCFLAYEPLSCRQQKCLGHLLRRCKEIQEEPRPAEAVRLSRQVAALLRGAITLWRRQEQMEAQRYARACERLEGALDRLLAQEPPDEAAARLVKLLRKQRQRLFTFLYMAGVEPTNNAAERAIRPAGSGAEDFGREPERAGGEGACRGDQLVADLSAARAGLPESGHHIAAQSPAASHSVGLAWSTLEGTTLVGLVAASSLPS